MGNESQISSSFERKIVILSSLLNFSEFNEMFSFWILRKMHKLLFERNRFRSWCNNGTWSYFNTRNCLFFLYTWQNFKEFKFPGNFFIFKNSILSNSQTPPKVPLNFHLKYEPFHVFSPFLRYIKMSMKKSFCLLKYNKIMMKSVNVII